MTPPIPDAVAGRQGDETTNLDILAVEVIRVCNARLAGKISEKEWLAAIEKMEKEFGRERNK